MTNVGIYARISRDRDGTGLGTKRQITDCRKKADERGWTVVDEYVDDDVSAYSGRHRPEYERMLADIRDGRIDGVVVYHTDRLVRRSRELEDFIDLTEQHGIAQNLATVSGDIDLATGEGRLVARIHGAVAGKESDDKSRRNRRKHQELAEAGKVSGGGTRPFGYEQDRLTIRPSEARLIREATKRILAGDSLRSVCKDWTDRGVQTVTGKPWTSTVLRSLLHSGRISGRREHRGEIVTTAEWPGIITPEQSDALRALLDAPHRRKSRTARRNVLTRILRCGKCDTVMIGRPRADGRRRYVCPNGPGQGCGGTMIVADELEQLVAAAVIYRLDTPELDHALRNHDDDQQADELADLIRLDEERLNQLTDAWTDGDLTMAEWKRAGDTIKHRLTEHRRRLAKQSNLAAVADWIGNGELLQAQWADLSLPRQQAIIMAVIDHIVIGPGRRGYNRFDHTRVTPIWRDAQAAPAPVPN